MRYVTTAQMRAIDKAAIEEYGVPAKFLMENAGKAVAEKAMEMVPPCEVMIFCGYGNNGGDGFVSARYLKNNGYDTGIFLVGGGKGMSPESETNFVLAKEAACSVRTLKTEDDIRAVLNRDPKPGLIIDAIFGTGARGPLGEFFVELISGINSSGVPVLAVDVPSGLDADSGLPNPVAISAAVTVTLGFPKAGFRNAVSAAFTGEVTAADIGIPAVAAAGVGHEV